MDGHFTKGVSLISNCCLMFHLLIFAHIMEQVTHKCQTNFDSFVLNFYAVFQEISSILCEGAAL